MLLSFECNWLGDHISVKIHYPSGKSFSGFYNVITSSICEKCGNPFLMKYQNQTFCLESSLHNYLSLVDHTFQLGLYYKKSSMARKASNDLLNDHIWRAKEHPEYTKPLVQALSLLINYKYPELLTKDLIVPVPSYNKDKDVNANGIALQLQNILKKDGRECRVENCLEKIKDIKLQYLNKKQRDDAVTGMFRYDKNISIFGQTVILLDDILTAGHVVGACAELLKSNGAAEISVLVVGRDT